MSAETVEEAIRVFAAIRPSQAILDPLQEWWDTARKWLPKSDWRPMPVENWHVTLAFYGELAVDALPGLRARLAEIAVETTPFEIEIRGFGVFPNTDQARIFWAGAFGEPADTLAGLAHRCLHAVESGFKNDPRKAPKTYRGHISLARARGRRKVDLSAFVKHPPPDLKERVDAITLYRSDLTPEGSRYTPIERFLLAG